MRFNLRWSVVLMHLSGQSVRLRLLNEERLKNIEIDVFFNYSLFLAVCSAPCKHTALVCNALVSCVSHILLPRLTGSKQSMMTLWQEQAEFNEKLWRASQRLYHFIKSWHVSKKSLHLFTIYFAQKFKLSFYFMQIKIIILKCI